MDQENYAEPPHPQTGAELTDVDRTLLRLNFVSTEISILVRGIRAAQRAGEPNERLIFSLGNHALLLVWKFVEIYHSMGQAQKLPRMIAARRAVTPLIDRIMVWPDLEAYRDTALAHPYLNKRGKFIHPSWLMNSGDAPTRIAESLMLASCAYFAAAGICAAFAREYGSLMPMFRMDKALVPELGVRGGEDIGPALQPLVQVCANNLENLESPNDSSVTAKLFDLFCRRIIQAD